MRRQIIDPLVLKPDLTAGSRNQTGDSFQESGFTRTVGTDYTDYFSLIYFERKIFDDLNIAITGIKDS